MPRLMYGSVSYAILAEACSGTRVFRWSIVMAKHGHVACGSIARLLKLGLVRRIYRGIYEVTDEACREVERIAQAGRARAARYEAMRARPLLRLGRIQRAVLELLLSSGVKRFALRDVGGLASRLGASPETVYTRILVLERRGVLRRVEPGVYEVAVDLDYALPAGAPAARRDIDAYADRLRKLGYSRSTVLRSVCAIRQYHEFLGRRGLEPGEESLREWVEELRSKVKPSTAKVYASDVARYLAFLKSGEPG